MNRTRWRLKPLLFAGVIAVLVPVIVLSERAAEWAVRRVAETGVADALGDLRATFLVLGVVAVLAAAALTAALGGHLVDQLRRLRTDAAARSRGERVVISKAEVVEVQAAAGAIELLATELEKRCDSLVAERDELALLLNSVSEGILKVSADGRIMHANPSARLLLGMRVAGTTGSQPVAALVRNAELRDVIEQAARGVRLGAREVSLDDRRLLVAARPLQDAPDEAGQAGAVVAFTDLTEIRRLEGVRRDFVANVSHELKTPLTSIRGYVETLLGDEIPVDLQRQFLEVIRNNAERLHGIVDDLLDLSRLESGGWRPELRRLATMELVEDVWNNLRDHAARKDLEFVPAGGGADVIADPAGLRQVLSNLLDNAIRYTPGGGRITVRVTHQAEPSPTDPEEAVAGLGTTEPPAPAHGWTVIEVRDTGAGIPRDALPRIFERFYRVDPARSRAEGGTGLGLSIVRHLVESMDGDVRAASELGKGTTITVRLPAA